MTLNKSENELKVINPLTIANWNDLILDSKNYSIFHSKEWCELLEKTYNYEPLYFIAFDKEKLKILIPMMLVKSIFTGKRLVSLPFSDYCEPLIENEFEYDDLLKEIVKLGQQKGARYIEFKGGEQYFIDQPVFSNGYLHKLELSLSEDELFNNLRKSNKRNIKKAIKENVEVRFSYSHSSLVEYYKLHVLTRKKHGLPPQPFKFFDNIYKMIISKGMGSIVESLYKGQVISSCIFFTFGKKVLYKFGASDMRYQNLRANNLLFWEAIKYYSNMGYEELCFGRTSAQSESLRQFKTGWGVNETPSPFYRYSFKSNEFESGGKFALDSPSEVGSHNYIFKHAPKPVLKLIGNITYRHIG